MSHLSGQEHKSPQASDLDPSVTRMCERLSALLLERLPTDLATQLIDMLPDDKKTQLSSLKKSADSESDTSIGYPTFIERAAEAIGTGQFKGQSDEKIREIVDAFLWGVVQEVPADFKARLHEVLPSELKSRMDLYSDRQNESKVA
jgi:hypothetical protein